MRILYKVLLGMLPLLAVASGTLAQSVTIGAGLQSGTSVNGATGDSGPMYKSSATSGFNYSRYHYLYTQAELSAVGLPTGSIITGLTWYKDNIVTNVGTTDTFEIYMKNSSLTVVQTAPQTFAALTAGSALAYSTAALNIANPAGPVPFTLGTPFVYTGGALEITTRVALLSSTTAGISWLRDPINDRVLAYTNTSDATTLNVARTVRPQLMITYTPGGPCTSPPTAGTTTSSATGPVCAGSTVNLGLSGNTNGTGQTHQLLSATAAGGPYTAVGAAQAGTSFSVNPTSTTFYRIRVLCGSTADTSTVAQVSVPTLFPGGTYTINNASPTAGTNFNSFSAAAAAISCGTAGPVVFNVVNNPTPYNEQFSLAHINTLSSVNTVTFNGNGAVISFNSGTAQPAVITLNGADWIRIRRLNIQGLSSTATGIQLINDANNIIVDSCNITLDTTSTATTNGGISISGSLTSGTTAGSNCDSITLTNNDINGGYVGIGLTGAAGLLSTGNLIANNTVRNFYVYGMYTIYLDATDIDANDVHRLTRPAVTTFYGIFVATGSVGVRVRKNRIHDPAAVAPTTSFSSYGIYFSSADGTAASPHEASNNLLYNFRQNGLIYALYNAGSDYVRYYHNTVSLDDSGATTVTGVTRGFFQTTLASNIELKNNIISVRRNTTSAKHAVYFATATSTFSAATNVYYVTAPISTGGYAYYSATNYPSLSAYQAASMQDTGTIDTDPSFTAPASNNYIPTSLAVNNIGTAVGIVTDILNNPRSPVNPDPGAFEIGFVQCLAPTGLTAANVTASSANLSWNAILGAFGFRYAVTTSSTPPASGTFTTGNTFNPTGLAGSTTYYLHVRVECTAGNFSPWSTLSFTTGCSSVNTTVNTGGPTTFCAGNSVTLTAATGTGYSYQWKLDGSNIPGATGVSYAATVTGVYSVLVTSSPVCSANSAPVAVTVNPLPPSTATSGGTNLCAGNSLVLSAPTGTGLSYQWYNGAALITGATGQTYSATTAGSYTVVVSNANCSATSAPLVITANTPLVLSTTPGSRCDSGTVNLAATGSTGTTLNWYAAPTGGTPLGTGSPFTTPFLNATDTFYAGASIGTGGGAANNSITTNTTATTSGSGTGGLMIDINASTAFTIDSIAAFFVTAGLQTFDVYVRSGTHCGFQTSTAGWTLVSTGTVNPPVASGTVSHTFALATPVPIPAGVSGVYFNYNARYTSTTSCTSFSISNPDMTITAGTAHTGLFTSTLSRQFCGTLIYSKGCESPRVPVIATVNPLPPASASASGSTTVCQGETVTLNGNAGPTYTYQWQNNGAAIAGATSPSYLATNSGSYAIAVSDGLCTDTSASVIVTVNPTPVSTITPPGPASFCVGGSLPVNGPLGSGFTYAWLQSGIPIPGATGSFYVITGSGSYSLVVTDNACSDTSALLVATVNPLPVPVITVAGNVLSTAAASTYQWFLNGTSIAGATTQSITATQSGSYTVTVTDSNGCTGTSTASAVVVTGIRGQTADGVVVRIYPNPARTVVFVEADRQVDISLLGVDGKLLMHRKSAQSVDISSLAAGLYTIKVYDASGSLLKTEKLIKAD